LKKKILNVLKFLIFLGVGAFLFWFVYKDQDIKELLKELKTVNYFWLGLSLFLGILSHISRAMRWKMLGQSLGYKPSVLTAFLAIMVGYLANLAFPRMGEVSRAAIIKRYEKIPFSESFGTVVIERIIDLISLFLLAIIVIVTQFKVVAEFVKDNPSVGDKFQNFSFSGNLIIILLSIIVLLIILFYIFKSKIKKTFIYIKFKELLKEFMDGIRSIKNIKNLPIFLAHTVFIWFMYFLMLYVTYYAFDFTSNLTLITALTVFVFGSFGMVAPVQGGIGAWHFMVIGVLIIYGISETNASAFALIVHGVQTLMLVVVGFLSLIALPIINKK